jgi:hypothetical protein
MYVIKRCLAYDVHKFSSGRGQGARESEPGGAIPGSAVPKVHSVTIDFINELHHKCRMLCLGIWHEGRRRQTPT